MKKFYLACLCFAVYIQCGFAQYVTTLAGFAQGMANGTGTAAAFFDPAGITIVAGNVFVADKTNNCIRKVTPAGVVTTFAGSLSQGFSNGTGTAATFFNPSALCADQSGNIYVADALNHAVRKITPAGVVTTLAGTGTAGYLDGAAASAKFNYPTGVICDLGGNVYVCDKYNNRIRVITTTGSVTTLAGSGTAGFANGTGTAAMFNNPAGIAYDGNGNLYVTDQTNNRIRKIAITTSVVTLIAGSGVAGSADGAAGVASFNFPAGIHSDGTNLYVADLMNHKIRKIVISTGVVSTFAGSGTAGFADGNAPAAMFDNPNDLRFYNSSVYVADMHNNRIRKIDPCNTPPFPADNTPPSNYTVCAGSTTTLSALGTGTINWYSSATGTSALASGPDYITSGTLNIGSYTLYAEDAITCTVSPRTPITFSVICCSSTMPPTNTTPAANTTVCAGLSTSLTATSSGTVNWYATPSAGSVIAGGSVCVTANTLAAGAYTYYAETVSSCTTSPTRTPVTFTINCCSAPNAPVNMTPANNLTVCTGSTGTLTASGNGLINWYVNASGGSTIASGTNYSIPAILPAGVYTVYAEAATSCSVSASRTPFTFTVVTCCFAPAPPQNATSADNATVCTGNSATLSAISPGTISWFTGVTGGTAVATGSTYVTSNTLSVGYYMYYAEAASSCSVSASRTAITFTVKDCVFAGLAVQQAAEERVTVYPNPGSGVFTVLANKGALKTLVLRDLTGRLLLSGASSDEMYQLHLETLADGIYYLEMRSSDRTEVVKIVKRGD